PGFLARLANRLHVPTRTGVIRRTLLLNPGDRYDSARVAESERALRGLHVFSRVRFDTTRLDGRLALRVATTDGWSTKPQVGYSSSGGSVSWLVGLVEDNLLGTATSLTAVYNDTPDRSIFSLRYVNPYLFARRARLSAEYKGKSDGRRGQWLAGVPFYEIAAPRALLTDGQAASERILRCRHGSPLVTLERLRVPAWASRCGGNCPRCGRAGSSCCAPGRTESSPPVFPTRGVCRGGSPWPARTCRNRRWCCT